MYHSCNKIYFCVIGNGSDMNLATAVVKANEEQRQNDISIEKRIKLQQTIGEYISPENRK